VLIEHGSVALARAERGVSRRRVVQGVAWSVPAVLIATAAPAAAASPAVQGRIALTGSSAAMNTANFFVTTNVNYLGDGSPHPDYPVSGITIEVAIPTNRVVAGSPGVAALDWSYVGSIASGGITRYTFQWNGLPLSSTSPATSRVTVRVPATTSLDPVDITITGRGTSNGAAVTPAVATVAAVMGADLVVDDATIEYIEWMPAPGGGTQNGYNFRGKGRWHGPYDPEGSNITNLELVIRIPQANTDGTYQVAKLGAGWSLQQAPTLKSGVWEARWRFANAIGNANRNTTDWEIRFKALGPKQLNVATSALSGLAAGSPNYFAWHGPAF